MTSAESVLATAARWPEGTAVVDTAGVDAVIE